MVANIDHLGCVAELQPNYCFRHVFITNKVLLVLGLWGTENQFGALETPSQPHFKWFMCVGGTERLSIVMLMLLHPHIKWFVCFGGTERPFNALDSPSHPHFNWFMCV
jgi:hypothetical protein